MPGWLRVAINTGLSSDQSMSINIICQPMLDFHMIDTNNHMYGVFMFNDIQSLPRWYKPRNLALPAVNAGTESCQLKGQLEKGKGTPKMVFVKWLCQGRALLFTAVSAMAVTPRALIRNTASPGAFRCPTVSHEPMAWWVGKLDVLSGRCPSSPLLPTKLRKAWLGGPRPDILAGHGALFFFFLVHFLIPRPPGAVCGSVVKQHQHLSNPSARSHGCPR